MYHHIDGNIPDKNYKDKSWGHDQVTLTEKIFFYHE